MKNCPNFVCLDYNPQKCNKYPGCEGCPKLNSCDVCERRTVLIDDAVIHCDLIPLPEVCRFCDKRFFGEDLGDICDHCTKVQKEIN